MAELTYTLIRTRIFADIHRKKYYPGNLRLPRMIVQKFYLSVQNVITYLATIEDLNQLSYGVNLRPKIILKGG